MFTSVCGILTKHIFTKELINFHHFPIGGLSECDIAFQVEGKLDK